MARNACPLCGATFGDGGARSEHVVDFHPGSEAARAVEKASVKPAEKPADGPEKASPAE